MESFIDSLSLPIQLKDYFLTSKVHKDELSEEVLLHIEELYILYKSLYMFDETDFSVNVIMTIKRCKDFSTFYFYLKKILESNLELVSKDTAFNQSEGYINIERELLDSVFKESTKDYIQVVNIIYDKPNSKDIDITNVYKNLGKMELINELIEDEYYEELLDAGKEIIGGICLN